MTITRSCASIAVVVLLLAFGACAEPPAAGPGNSSNERRTRAPVLSEGDEAHGDENSDFPDRPPPVTIHYSDRSSELEAWTFCYRNGCADGAPPKDPLDVGSPESIGVRFPLEDWSFGATFEEAGKRCARQQRAHLEQTGEGEWVLEPHGHPGTYDVTLFGRGDGDLFVTFRWTTTREGPLPKPSARAAILADHDGAVDSYGIEVMLSNLAETPNRAEAAITVEASDGDSLTFDAKRAGGCWPEGTVYWDGPDDKGLEAAELGEAPFEYEVVVMLDGERHVANAVWPDDEIKGNEPSVRLDFEPPLPAPR